MSECKECRSLMGTNTPPHKSMVKICQHHTHPIYRCKQCDTELVRLFDCWEPSFPGWLPRPT